MAVKYELGNGRTVFLSMEEYLNLDDDKVQELIAKQAGIEIDDPFSNFDIREYNPIKSNIPPIEGLDEIGEEELKRIKDELKDEFPEES